MAGGRAPFAWTARKVAMLVLALGGLGVSTYLTIAHYDHHLSLVCPATTTINCETVTTSAQSIVFGVPVSDLGLAFFVGMVALSLPVAWRVRTPVVPVARLASVVVGIGFVFYLLYSELFTIHAICLWCTSVHVLTFILFVLTVTGWDEAMTPVDEARAGTQ